MPFAAQSNVVVSITNAYIRFGRITNPTEQTAP